MITEYTVPTYGNSDPSEITIGPDGALWFQTAETIGRITTVGAVTEYPLSDFPQFGGITTDPDGVLWYTIEGGIGRAPARGLGFSASFANSILTMNFNLGINTPATFNLVLHDSTGFGKPVLKAIPTVVPPKAFTINWNNFPEKGYVTVAPQLSAGPGQVLCAERTTVSTTQ